MRRFSRYLYLGVIAWALAACVAEPPPFKGTDLSNVNWGGDIRLQAHTGVSVSTTDFRNKVLVLFFGYTHCPDICTPTLTKLAALRKNLGNDADRLQVFFITVDPLHDTPPQLAFFVPKFDPTFIGLTGKYDEIAAVASEYKVPLAPERKSIHAHPAIDHSGVMMVKDGNGKLRLMFANDMAVADMEHDIRLLLKDL